MAKSKMGYNDFHNLTASFSYHSTLAIQYFGPTESRRESRVRYSGLGEMFRVELTFHIDSNTR